MRVVDMRGVDFERYAFDFDLTFAVLVMHPDGTIYHRYGGRDHRSSATWLGAQSFETLLRETLVEHAEYARAPAPPPPATPQRIEDVPSFAKKDGGKCIHCHSVLPALADEAKLAGTWRDVDAWRHPQPARIGLDLDADDQRRVTSVAQGSPAAAAGLIAGDRLVRLGEQRVLTASDVMWVLDGASANGTRLPLTFEREGEPHAVELVLAAGWKVGTALEFAWRPFKWELEPAVGFGGEALNADEKHERGLEPDAFAFFVTYFVEGGEQRRFGQAAKQAGVAKRDIVLGADGKRDFASHDHFQAWWRLERSAGDTVEVELLRNGARTTVRIQIPE